MEERLNKVHQRALQLVHENSHDFTFEELLTKDNLFSVHQKILHIFANETFKSKKRVSPEIMDDIPFYRKTIQLSK